MNPRRRSDKTRQRRRLRQGQAQRATGNNGYCQRLCPLFFLLVLAVANLTFNFQLIHIQDPLSLLTYNGNGNIIVSANEQTQFIVNHVLDSKSTQMQVPVMEPKNARIKDTVDATKPLVSFIIPSKLNRSTLERTLQSLLSQTNEHWEAIVGIDVTTIRGGGRKTEREILAGASGFPQDPRIQYCIVHTKETFRGRKGNGSALVRNQIILNFATADWVAFVDDDDSLSPFYVEMLEDSNHNNNLNHNSYDIILFRMQGFPEPTSVLPPYHLQELGIGDFGISFAVRRSLFQEKSMLFVPHPSEDYFYVQNAIHQGGAVMGLSTCNLYFIRQGPNPSRPICNMEDDTTKSIRLTGKNGILATGGTVPTIMGP